MDIALLETVVGVAAVGWVASLVWSLYVILTTPHPTWMAARLSQTMWLAVVSFIPFVGTVLFAAVGYRQLFPHRTFSLPAGAHRWLGSPLAGRHRRRT